MTAIFNYFYPKPTTHFDKLLPENIEEIFTHLPLQDRMACAKVCKKWRDISHTLLNKEIKSACQTPMWKSLDTCEYLFNTIPIYNNNIVTLKRQSKCINLSIFGAGFVVFLSIVIFLSYVSSFDAELRIFFHLSSVQQKALIEKLNNETITYSQLNNITLKTEDLYQSSDDYINKQRTDINFTKLIFTICFVVFGTLGLAFLAGRNPVVKSREKNKNSELTSKIAKDVTYPKFFLKDKVIHKHLSTYTEIDLSSEYMFVPLLPVSDPCGHLFDYKKIQAYIEKNHKCHLSQLPLELKDLQFDVSLFFKIQRRVKELKTEDSQARKSLESFRDQEQDPEIDSFLKRKLNIYHHNIESQYDDKS